MTTEAHSHWPTVHGRHFNPDASDAAVYLDNPETPRPERVEMPEDYRDSTNSKGGQITRRTSLRCQRSRPWTPIARAARNA